MYLHLYCGTEAPACYLLPTEGKLSTTAWNINWHEKLLTHIKWGTLGGHRSLPTAPRHSMGCPPSLTVVSAPTSLGHRHQQVHLPREHIHTARYLLLSWPVSPPRAKPLQKRGAQPPSELRGTALDTSKKQLIVLVAHEEITYHLLFQKCLKVFYLVNSRSAERTCGMDYTDPF